MRATRQVYVLAILLTSFPVQAQVQSPASADRSATKNISKALVEAGIDPRTTSVKVLTTSDHIVYLTGLIADRDTIKRAGDVAAKTAPGYRIVNRIRSSFFADPNHVTGEMTK